LASIYQTIKWPLLVELFPEKKTISGTPSWLRLNASQSVAILPQPHQLPQVTV